MPNDVLSFKNFSPGKSLSLLTAMFMIKRKNAQIPSSQPPSEIYPLGSLEIYTPSSTSTHRGQRLENRS
jgi:hypothetical protein